MTPLKIVKSISEVVFALAALAVCIGLGYSAVSVVAARAIQAGLG